MLFGIFGGRKNGLKAKADFVGDKCFFSLAGKISIRSPFDAVEREFKRIESNYDWRVLEADFSKLTIKGSESLPTYFVAIIIRLIRLTEIRRGYWKLILADREQAEMIYFFRFRGRDHLSDRIVFADQAGKPSGKLD